MTVVKKQASLMQAFNRAADPAAPARPSKLNLLDAILAERPDLKGLPVEVPERGAIGNTIMIGDEVFKGPKATIAVPKHDQECETLQKLAGQGLPVPDITYVGKDTVFFGMTRLPGVTFAEVEMTDDEERQLGRDVEDVLIDVAKVLPSPKEDELLLNVDMNSGNILVDPDTKKLTGVIDFGCVASVKPVAFRRHARGPHPNPRSAFEEGTRAEFDAREGELLRKLRIPRPS